MKFKIESAELTSALAAIAKAIPAKPSIPMLSNFLIELSNGLVRITASDSEIALRGLVRPDETDDNGSTAVPAKVLLDLLNTLPQGPVQLEMSKDALSVKVKWASGESILPAFAPGDYIDIAVPDKDGSVKFTTVTDVLMSAVRKTIGSVGTDEARPVLCGIYFDIQSGKSSIVASDASRLLAYEVETPDVSASSPFILPAKAASILKGILPKDHAVTVVSDGTNARFAFGSTEMTIRLLVGKYPAWRTIVPKKNDNVLGVKREDMMQALRRMGVLADKKTSIVKVDLTFNKMTITAEDLGLSMRGDETLVCDYDGNNMKIGLKATSLIETLSVFDTEEIEIRFMDERHAILIGPAGEKASEEPLMAVIMPLKI